MCWLEIITSRTFPYEERAIGKYGCIHREYLKENNPMLYDEIVLSKQLFSHLYEVQEIAEKRVKRIIKKKSFRLTV